MTAGALKRDRRGSVALETALVLSLCLLPLLYGTTALGPAVSTQMRLDRALHAAMLYAWATPGAASSGIQAAANKGYGVGDPAMTPPAASIGYACVSPTGTRQSGTPPGANGACPSNTVKATFVTVSLSATISVNLPLPASLATQTLTASGTVRQQ